MKSFKEFLHEQNNDKWLNVETIKEIWEDANDKVFQGQLDKPKFTLEDDLNYINKRYPHNEEARNGDIVAFCDKEGSKFILRFCKSVIKNPRDLMEVVVHEMVHQAEAERTTYLKMCEDPHGDNFFAWADAVATYHNMVLKVHQ
jgi:hypothetical protein